MGLFGPKGGAQGGGKGSPPRAPKVGPTRAHLGAPTRAIKGGERGRGCVWRSGAVTP